MIENSKVESQSTPVRAPSLAPTRSGLYRWLATSQQPLPRLARTLNRAALTFSVPAPRVLIRPIRWIFVGVRGTWHFALRVFVCEPLFKSYCKQYGRRLRTDCRVHWVAGKGDIVVGDDVWLDGKITITFAARFADRPLFEIGSNTGIGNGCVFHVAKRISIGRDCKLSGEILVMDSNGHHTDPVLRWAERPPDSEDVRPVTIGDGVWIGARCIIFPGVRIGEGSVVAAGSIVRTHVPPYSVVAGNPAKIMFRLKKPDAPAARS
jgi:acetyltransferase-like isoleucine patch superfamily enzyme